MVPPYHHINVSYLLIDMWLFVDCMRINLHCLFGHIIVFVEDLVKPFMAGSALLVVA